MKDTSTPISYNPKRKLLIKTINKRFDGHYVVLDEIEMKGSFYKALVVAYAKTENEIRRKKEALINQNKGFEATIFAGTRCYREDEETFMI